MPNNIIGGVEVYLKRIVVKNYGPIESLEYSFPFGENNTPKPVVILGQNGAGKTLLLTNIVHAIIEMKRRRFDQIPEVSDRNFFRAGSMGYIRNGSEEMYEQFEFSDNAKYTELFASDYQKYISQEHAEYSDVNKNDSVFINTGFFARAEPPNIKVFQNQMFLYFPVDRYYVPTWENIANENADRIVENENFAGVSDSEIVKYDVLKGVSEWLLNVILEKELYERKLVVNEEKNLTQLIYDGKNTRILKAVSSILNIIFASPVDSNYVMAVSKKTRLARKLHIVKTQKGRAVSVVSKISNLSSGEAMLLGMTTQILREYDRLSDQEFSLFDEIEGIVIVDEADVHLHSDLLKRALPALITLFPKVQFIISTHSPLFLLGMKEAFGDGCQFLNLPDGLVNNDVESFSEIENYFSAMDNTYRTLVDKYNDIIGKVKRMSKTLVITEGKTDWKHYKKALQMLQQKGEFCNLEIEFLEYSDPMGEQHLEGLLKNLGRVPRNNKIIGIFDNDTLTGKRHENPIGYGNGVFGVSICDVWGYGSSVSVEMLYKREDLKKITKEGKSIFLSDEFSEKSGRCSSNQDIVCQNNTLIAAYKNKTIKVIDDKVFDKDDKNIALSKEEFAQLVIHGEYPYENVDFSGFSGLFAKLVSILNGKDE